MQFVFQNLYCQPLGRKNDSLEIRRGLLAFLTTPVKISNSGPNDFACSTEGPGWHAKLPGKITLRPYFCAAQLCEHDKATPWADVMDTTCRTQDVGAQENTPRPDPGVPLITRSARTATVVHRSTWSNVMMSRLFSVVSDATTGPW